MTSKSRVNKLATCRLSDPSKILLEAREEYLEGWGGYILSH